MKSNERLWECASCRVTVRVLHHGTGPVPDGRACKRCGRDMGLVLFTGAAHIETLPTWRPADDGQIN